MAIQMFYLRKILNLCCPRLALAFCCLGFCCPCLASAWDKYVNQDAPRLDFVPISLMDDETLISSAAMRRDARMNSGCRLLNSHWLAQNSSNTFFGGTAINQFLKTGFKQFWKNRFGGISDSPDRYTSFLQEEMTYIGNYAVDLSEDRILVGVKFSF